MTEEMQPSYYAVIPANVRYDSRLIPRAILLYGEITALSNKTGQCWASDSYFAKIYGVSERSIQDWLTSLEKCGYIHRYTERKGVRVTKRYLTLLQGTEENFRKGTEENFRKGTEENFRENNTSINNTSTNKKILSSSDEHDRIPLSEIVDYLNLRSGKHYRSTTPKTERFISARVKEGFTADDFKKVIDNKVSEWQGTDMEKYLRPETLFGTKFESYLNQGIDTKRSEAAELAKKNLGF
ncbi:conserved phage C-terminal domain-containing protein [Eupransor demetentiae]|uniref:DNA replication protein DnaD (DnaD) n=1 Tax=Eupransor demetentiae TaxID=3109584 RepID=A0ABP0EPF5_9LACO|nr:DNA replication protein DnaD (DnaD) [Lactobacillaceae bacterium LMG 33000]